MSTELVPPRFLSVWRFSLDPSLSLPGAPCVASGTPGVDLHQKQHHKTLVNPLPSSLLVNSLHTRPMPSSTHLILGLAQTAAAGHGVHMALQSYKDALHTKQRRSLLLTNCRVIDVEAGQELGGEGALHQVLINADGTIGSISPMAGGVPQLSPESVIVDCEGLWLLPGLMDAHVHVTATTANLSGLMSLPESLVTAKAADICMGMLARGFTTVRDAGGADFGLAQAIEEGLILGPRLLFTGHALSQTGGHGDFRGRGEEACACGSALRGIGRVCDGDAEVRRAARDELRKGAHCIKVMASGGISSPTDRLTNTQFSMAELTAIVEEAAAAKTYVCAHAYKPDAMQRALKAGVRSIEHGNWLDEDTAQLMAQKKAFLVPTISTYAALVSEGEAGGMAPELVAKVGDAVEQGLRSLEVARRAGVTMCYGSDLLGAMHRHQLNEIELRGRVLPPSEVLKAATVNCEELFMMKGQVGRIAPGYTADLILVAGPVSPLSDISLLSRTTQPSSTLAPAGGSTPGGPAGPAVVEGVVVVIKGGLLARCPGGSPLERLNAELTRSV